MKNTMIVIQAFFLCTFVVGVSAHESKKIDNSKNMGISENISGNIDPDADIEGITIINDKVFIDGEEIRRGQSFVVSKKTKKRYAINWKKSDPVVSEVK